MGVVTGSLDSAQLVLNQGKYANAEHQIYKEKPILIFKNYLILKSIRPKQLFTIQLILEQFVKLTTGPCIKHQYKCDKDDY